MAPEFESISFKEALVLFSTAAVFHSAETLTGIPTHAENSTPSSRERLVSSRNHNFAHLFRRRHTMHTILRASVITLLFSAVAVADEPLFSGPQVDEEIRPFEAIAAFGNTAAVNVFDRTNDSPILIVFVHQITRPSVGLMRLLMEFAATKEQEGLQSRLVFLSEDATETAAYLQRARHALPRGATALISTDGIEGPGAYGLNRKMTLTILVGSKGVVTANFPLVQPSVQADATKIGHEIVKVLGGTDAPTLRDMGYQEPRMPMNRGGEDRARQQSEQDAIYRQKIAPVIQKTATAEEVAAAAADVERFAAENRWFRERVYRASRQISEGPRLKDYGSAQSQEYLKKWAKEFAPKEVEPRADDNAVESTQNGVKEVEESRNRSDGSTAKEE